MQPLNASAIKQIVRRFNLGPLVTNMPLRAPYANRECGVHFSDVVGGITRWYQLCRQDASLTQI